MIEAVEAVEVSRKAARAADSCLAYLNVQGLWLHPENETRHDRDALEQALAEIIDKHMGTVPRVKPCDHRPFGGSLGH